MSIGVMDDIFESQVAQDKDYQSHKIFPLLDSFVEYYSAVYMLGPDFLTDGVLAGLLNIDKVVCSSLAGTLDSVRMVLKEGRLNDAYALLRKYHDGVIVAIYINVYIAENFTIDNYVIDKIQNWVNNKQKLPSSEEMLMLPSLSMTHVQSPETPSAILANTGITESIVAPMNEIKRFMSISFIYSYRLAEISFPLLLISCVFNPLRCVLQPTIKNS